MKMIMFWTMTTTATNIDRGHAVAIGDGMLRATLQRRPFPSFPAHPPYPRLLVRKGDLFFFCEALRFEVLDEPVKLAGRTARTGSQCPPLIIDPRF